jgi:hypothetical protein
MSVPDLYLADLTPEEAAAGFVVRPVGHPHGLPTLVPAVTRACGDPSHRLVKTRGRDGVVYQLQAFGRPPSGGRPADWYAERYWPGRYGILWVLDRLREHLGRPRYTPLIDLHVPPDDSQPAVAASPVIAESEVFLAAPGSGAARG